MNTYVTLSCVFLSDGIINGIYLVFTYALANFVTSVSFLFGQLPTAKVYLFQIQVLIYFFTYFWLDIFCLGDYFYSEIYLILHEKDHSVLSIGAGLISFETRCDVILC